MVSLWEKLYGNNQLRYQCKRRTSLSRLRLVAECTQELLATRGWCLWKCSALGGEVIAVVLDENVEGVPEGRPVYTEAKLKELSQEDVGEDTLRLVHEAKKLAGAKVTGDEGGCLC